METKNIFKPILFNTEMVQANLENRKKQTRRIAPFDKRCTKVFQSENGKWQQNYNNNPDPNKMFPGGWNEITNYISPYQIGDILWVRETTKVGAWNDDENLIAFDYKASPELTKTPWCYFDDEDKFNDIHLKAIESLDKMGYDSTIDEVAERVHYKWEAGKSPFNWTPSLFMPKEAARIFLKVTNVRCERLKDISFWDAINEGIEIRLSDGSEEFRDYLAKNQGAEFFGNWGETYYTSPINSFESLWQLINAKKHPWESNPWVWVYEYERIERPEDFN